MHNAGLSLLSAVLLIGVLYELWGYWMKHSQKGFVYVRAQTSIHVCVCIGIALSAQNEPHLDSPLLQAIWTLYCDPAPHQSRGNEIMFWYYMNYLTKVRDRQPARTLALCVFQPGATAPATPATAAPPAPVTGVDPVVAADVS